MPESLESTRERWTTEPLDIDERIELRQLREENRRLKIEREVLNKRSGGVVCEREHVKFGFIRNLDEA